MKVLVVYNSLLPQSNAGAAIAKLKYDDCVLMDLLGVTTGDISTAIGALTSIYDLILINVVVSTAATGRLSVAQSITLDTKCVRGTTVTGTASAGAVDSLTDAGSGWDVDEHVGKFIKITGGTGINQVREIESNTAEVITPTTNFDTAPDATSTYTICATREEFTYTIADTSGQKKRAILAWEHEKLFPSTPAPLLIYKLAGDKTTADATTNAQNVLDEGYITNAVKYFLRDLTSTAVMLNWSKLLFNGQVPDSTRTRRPDQDNALYSQMYDYGKLLKESATALSVSI